MKKLGRLEIKKEEKPWKPWIGGKVKIFDPDGLTVNQRRFVVEYIKDLNASKAVVRAGYSPTNASTHATKLLTSPLVKVVLEKELKRMTFRHAITAERVIEEIASIAFMDIRDAYNPDGSLKELKDMSENVTRALAAIETDEVRDEEGNTSRNKVTRVKFHEKVKCLELLAKYFKLLSDISEGDSKQIGELISAMRQKYMTPKPQLELDENKK